LGLHERLADASAEAWDDGTVDLGEILREQRTSIIVPSAVYMNVLRHALSGMKVRISFLDEVKRICADIKNEAGPGVADIMKLLGKVRCLERLKEGWEWVSTPERALQQY
jgi:hypothetical protein